MFTPIHFKKTTDKDLRSGNTLRKKNDTQAYSVDKDQDFSKVLNSEIEHQRIEKNFLVNETDSLESVVKLVSDLENQGNLLARLPSLENFNSYRSALQEVLLKIIPQTLELKKDFFLNSRTMSQKEYHLVQSVNQELSSLLKMIQSNQKNNLIIANQVVSIKGLIIDFYF